MTAHEYGPHDPTTVPATVSVGSAAAFGGQVEVPIPKAIVQQRRRINDLAHDAAVWRTSTMEG